MIERIHIQGFRRLADVDLPLKPLNVLIGANGCGKTTFLDVLAIISSSARGELTKTVSDIGGLGPTLTSLTTYSGPGHVRFGVTIRSTLNAQSFYEFDLFPIGVGYAVDQESFTEFLDEQSPLLYLKRDIHSVKKLVPAGGELRMIEENGKFSPQETALSVDDRLFVVTSNAIDFLSSSLRYHNLEIGLRSPARLPQQLNMATTPGANGEGLISCLFDLRESHPDRYDSVEAALRAAFPNFERLGFPPVAAGLLAMTWKDKTSKQPFYMHQLSEGTLRFLWLVTLLYSPGLTAITMIDEPEVSLHPELLAILAELFREASSRTQLIIATHSDRLIRYLKPEEVVAMNMLESGAVEMVRGSDMELEQWLKDYSMDELWSMGRLGGRAS